MNEFTSAVLYFRDLIWGGPLLALLIGTGLYLTVLLRGIQFRYLGAGLREIFSRKKIRANGDISAFAALMTALAGAIGTGAIVGVAAAIAIGGLGALFWMWVTAFLGMATKYAESLLAVKYREKDKRGEMIGGPMSYMEKGLGKKWMAIAFAACGAIASIGTGNLVQVNSIAEAVSAVWHINSWCTGAVLAVITGLVILGGVRSIGGFAAVLVPIMSLMYLLGGSVILFYHSGKILPAFSAIFSGAFYGQAAAGGFAGAGVMAALQMGVSRGVFSNEAGLGISSIASAAAKTDNPKKQAIITMAGTLISTLFVCTMTGLVIAVTGVLGAVESGAPLAILAFNSTIDGGGYIVTIGLILFAFSTVIAWGYYGEKCVEYMFGERAILVFRVVFTLLIIPGAAVDLHLAWAFADISNGLMAIPNLIALIALSKVLIRDTQETYGIEHGMA